MSCSQFYLECEGASLAQVRAALETGLGVGRKVVLFGKDKQTADPIADDPASRRGTAALAEKLEHLKLFAKASDTATDICRKSVPASSPSTSPQSPPRSPPRKLPLSPRGSPRENLREPRPRRRSPSPNMPPTKGATQAAARDENAGELDSAALHAQVAALTTTVDKCKRELRRKDRRLLELERMVAEGDTTANTLHEQQRSLFDKFCLLRQKYDGIKAHLREVLWDFVPSRQIPGVESQGPAWISDIPALDKAVIENADRVGCYELLETLGEGQFAAVRAVRIGWPELASPAAARAAAAAGKRPAGVSGGGAAAVLAVKMIHKAEVVSTTTLRRVDNEIRVLRRLRHDGIMRLYDVVHAPKCVYLVTDRAGRDLFEFFDEHLEGVSEPIAALLLHKIMTPVRYCHAMGVVHRDLKPENILFAERGAVTSESRVLLCDFGLCARVETTAEDEGLRQSGLASRPLTEFCGSPGFFAPEMLVRGSYDGKRADVWSVGCILLELVLGHEDFCRLWMGAYDYEKLKAPALFEAAVAESVAGLARELPGRLSRELVDFILTALSLDDAKRLGIDDMLRHLWMAANGLGPPTPERAAAEAAEAVAADRHERRCGAAAAAADGDLAGSGGAGGWERRPHGGSTSSEDSSLVGEAAGGGGSGGGGISSVSISGGSANGSRRWSSQSMLRIEVEFGEEEEERGGARTTSGACEGPCSNGDGCCEVPASGGSGQGSSGPATAVETHCFGSGSNKATPTAAAAAGAAVTAAVALAAESIARLAPLGANGAGAAPGAAAAGGTAAAAAAAAAAATTARAGLVAAAASAALGCSISDRARKQLPGNYLPPPCLPDTPNVQGVRRQLMQPTDAIMAERYGSGRPGSGRGAAAAAAGGGGSSASSCSMSPVNSPTVTPGGSPRKGGFFHARAATAGAAAALDAGCSATPGSGDSGGCGVGFGRGGGSCCRGGGGGGGNLGVMLRANLQHSSSAPFPLGAAGQSGLLRGEPVARGGLARGALPPTRHSSLATMPRGPTPSSC